MHPMFYFTGEYGARFFRTTTNSDDIIPRLVEIFRNIMWSVITNINSCLFHYLDSFGINLPGRICTCREDL